MSLDNWDLGSEEDEPHERAPATKRRKTTGELTILLRSTWVVIIIIIIIIIIITRWASKRQSHSIEYYDKDTLRHDSLTSLQAGLQVGPFTASQTEARIRYQASSDRLVLGCTLAKCLSVGAWCSP
jgi:hypothetical protein